jgi:hypothetical protein
MLFMHERPLIFADSGSHFTPQPPQLSGSPSVPLSQAGPSNATSGGASLAPSSPPLEDEEEEEPELDPELEEDDDAPELEPELEDDVSPVVMSDGASLAPELLPAPELELLPPESKLLSSCSASSPVIAAQPPSVMTAHATAAPAVMRRTPGEYRETDGGRGRT